MFFFQILEILIFGRTLVNKRFQDPVVRAIREIEIPMFVILNYIRPLLEHMPKEGTSDVLKSGLYFSLCMSVLLFAGYRPYFF